MNGKVLIKDISTDNRPRERLVTKGENSLSDIELLAIILRTGGKNVSATDLASHLLKKYSDLKSLLELDINQLIQHPNIGLAKACTLKAVSEICKRAYLDINIKNTVIKKPEDVFKLIKKDLFAKKQEHLYLISLDSRKKFISKDLICIGSINETLVPVREVVRRALINNAVHIIIAHNHPSDDPTPSQEDIIVTQKIAKACEISGVTLLDHLVISNHDYISIKSLNLFQSTNLNKKGGEK